MTERDVTTAAELKQFLEESKGVLVVDFHATYSQLDIGGAAHAE